MSAPGLAQMLVRVTRPLEGNVETERLLPVSFVPLIGEQGWSSAGHR